MTQNRPTWNTGFFLCLLAATLIIRLLSLGLYPLMDTTEARYAEMARLMVVSGDWITPYIEPAVPFWGKPPMQTWVSAASFALLGVNEFAARLPHLLAGFAVLFLVRGLAGRRYPRPQVLASMTLLATTAVFLVSVGAVMTDTLLLLSLTLCFASLWRVVDGADTWMGYGFFLGLGLGMLAKGPVAVVLVGIALGGWCLTGPYRPLLSRRLPWIRGTLLSLAVAAPWYLAAEWKTPGFLEYFFIGEHWLRFTVSGWEGDLYGEAHAEPRGTIWWYALLGGFPWSFFLIYLVVRERWGGQTPPTDPDRRRWRSFLWCWLLSPLLLFSPAANILPAYVLPATPALALLVVEYARNPLPRLIPAAALATPLLFCLAVGLLGSGRIEPKADKDLLRSAARTANAPPPIYWLDRPFSARFYSGGTAVRVTEESELLAQLGEEGMVVLPRDKDVPRALLDQYQCRPIDQNRKRRIVFCTRIRSTEVSGVGRGSRQSNRSEDL